MIETLPIESPEKQNKSLDKIQENEPAEHTDSSVQSTDESNSNIEEDSIDNDLKSLNKTIQEPEQEKQETVKIAVEEKSEEKPLTSPPRKSARLSAKRRDSAIDSDISVTKSESPIPRRRSLRRNSTSSQDIPPPTKSKEESVPQKLATIEETDKTDSQAKSIIIDNETRKSEMELVDELAASFVDEFIDE